MSKIRAFFKNLDPITQVTTILLILAGILGVILVVFPAPFAYLLGMTIDETEISALLGVMSLLALGIGLERLTLLATTIEKFDRIIPVPRVQRFLTNDELYREAERLVDERLRRVEGLRPHIRATALGNRPIQRGSSREKYFRTVAERLKQVDRAFYEVLVTPPSEEGRDVREEYLKSKNIRNRDSKYRVLHPQVGWSVDVFIIGRTHAIIAFPLPDQGLRCGIEIEDPHFVDELADWYDGVVRTIARDQPVSTGTVESP